MFSQILRRARRNAPQGKVRARVAGIGLLLSRDEAHQGKKDTMFSQIFRRVARSAGFACYLLVIVPLGVFLILEAFPGWLLPLMNTDAVPYYAVKSNYIPHPQLIFVRRTRSLSFMTGGELHANYSDYAKDEPLWSYTATYNEHGFRTNSKPPPHEVLVIGDSFVEIGERDDRTFSEIVASTTGMSTFNAGLGWYGPHHYLRLAEQYTAALKPKTVVISIFAGNDLPDIREFERWQQGGSYYEFVDQTANIVQRFFIALRQVYDAAIWYVSKSDEDDESERNVGIIRIGDVDTTMAFAYFDAPTSAADVAKTAEWRSLAQILVRIRDLASQANARLIVLLVPTKLQVYGHLSSHRSPDAFKERLPTQLRHESTFSDAFSTLAERLGLEHIDLRPTFRALASRCLLYYPFDTHWNARARRIAADLIAERIANDGLRQRHASDCPAE